MSGGGRRENQGRGRKEGKEWIHVRGGKGRDPKRSMTLCGSTPLYLDLLIFSHTTSSSCQRVVTSFSLLSLYIYI
jgi:hypothetical protein